MEPQHAVCGRQPRGLAARAPQQPRETSLGDLHHVFRLGIRFRGGGHDARHLLRPCVRDRWTLHHARRARSVQRLGLLGLVGTLEASAQHHRHPDLSRSLGGRRDGRGGRRSSPSRLRFPARHRWNPDRSWLKHGHHRPDQRRGQSGHQIDDRPTPSAAHRGRRGRLQVAAGGLGNPRQRGRKSHQVVA